MPLLDQPKSQKLTNVSRIMVHLGADFGLSRLYTHLRLCYTALESIL